MPSSPLGSQEPLRTEAVPLPSASQAARGSSTFARQVEPLATRSPDWPSGLHHPSREVGWTPRQTGRRSSATNSSPGQGSSGGRSTGGRRPRSTKGPVLADPGTGPARSRAARRAGLCAGAYGSAPWLSPRLPPAPGSGVPVVQSLAIVTPPGRKGKERAPTYAFALLRAGGGASPLALVACPGDDGAITKPRKGKAWPGSRTARARARPPARARSIAGPPAGGSARRASGRAGCFGRPPSSHGPDGEVELEESAAPPPSRSQVGL
jgi:hypothetical protein